MALEGRGPIFSFRVVDRVVDLAHARHVAPELLTEALPALAEAEDPDTCTLQSLLEAAPCFQIGHCERQGFLAQFLGQLAGLLEEELLGVPRRDLSLRAWVGNSLLQLQDDATDVDRGARAAFLRAWGDEDNKLLKEEQVVNVCLDDSRVGRRHWKLIAIAYPHKRITSWLFPQAAEKQKDSQNKANA